MLNSCLSSTISSSRFRSGLHVTNWKSSKELMHQSSEHATPRKLAFVIHSAETFSKTKFCLSSMERYNRSFLVKPPDVLSEQRRWAVSLLGTEQLFKLGKKIIGNTIFVPPNLSTFFSLPIVSFLCWCAFRHVLVDVLNV